MQIQFSGRGWVQRLWNKAPWFNDSAKLTSQSSRRAPHLPAAKRSSPIKASVRQQQHVADFSTHLRCLFPPRSLQPLLRSSCGLAWFAMSLRSLGCIKQTQRAVPQPYPTTARSVSSKYWLALLRPLDACACLMFMPPSVRTLRPCQARCIKSDFRIISHWLQQGPWTACWRWLVSFCVHCRL